MITWYSPMLLVTYCGFALMFYAVDLLVSYSYHHRLMPGQIYSMIYALLWPLTVPLLIIIALIGYARGRLA